MSKALHRSEQPIAGVKRILAAQLDQTQRELRRPRLSDKRVHDVRKELKRARANLRLLRRALGENAYQRANRLLRDAARPLTPLRDAKVLVDRLDALIEDGAPRKTAAKYARLRRRLQKQRRRMRKRLPAAASAAKPKLAAVRTRLRALPPSSRADTLAPCLAETYKKARKAFSRAQAQPSDAGLHEWRKQVKYLREQLEVVMPLSPRRSRKLAKRANRIAHLLGDDHDLSVLEQKLGGRPAKLERDRAKLQSAAARLGRRLHRDSPRRFARRYEKALQA